MKNGFLLINKSKDWTSFDVCKKLSHKFSLEKIGHNGTLDPFATGLLLIAFGDATKLLSFMENDKKTYLAKLVLGKKTSTGDLTGEVIEEKQISPIDKDTTKNVLTSLLGNQKQIPPMTSAIHVDGRKLYELAHEGKTVERKARDIFIYGLELVDIDENAFTFKATVSKGTYIRTLGETIAEKLNNVGYLETLDRIQIGDFKIEDAKAINDVEESDALDMFEVIKTYMPVYKVQDEETLKKVKHGGKLSLKLFDDLCTQYCVVDIDNNVQAIYQLKEKEYYFCARNLNNNERIWIWLP